MSLGVNTSLSSPLLSRFDIVLVLQDLKNPEWDATVADHILSAPTSAVSRDSKELDTARFSSHETTANVFLFEIVRLDHLKAFVLVAHGTDVDAMISEF